MDFKEKYKSKLPSIANAMKKILISELKSGYKGLATDVGDLNGKLLNVAIRAWKS